MPDVVPKPNATCIGLDFGTTNSSVALYRDNLQMVNLDGSVLFKSVITYGQTVIKSIKRIISNLDEIHKLDLPVKIEDGLGYIYVENSWKSVIEIASDLLKNIRFATNKALNQDIRNAVLTVPARFDEVQRQFVIEAATLAGWSIRRVIAEPTAAFLAQDLNQDGIYGVYDLGGGTFDFSILRKIDDVVQVIATTGNTALGGDYFDEILAKSNNISIEDAKSMREQSELNLTDCNDLIGLSIYKCQELIQLHNVEVDLIILVGGSIYMKDVQEAVRSIGIPIKVSNNPQEVVARGAAIYAKQIMQENLQLLIDVTPLSLGVETVHGMVEWIISRNSPLPFAKKMVFTNSDPNQTHILFHIVQGEGVFAKDCRSIGRFKIPIVPQKRNHAKIEVEFLLNPDGLLQINCSNLNNHDQKYSIEFEAGNGLTQTMINRILENCTSNPIEKEMQKEFYKVYTEIELIVTSLGEDNIDTTLLARYKSLNNLHESVTLLQDLENKYSELMETKFKAAVQKLIANTRH